MSDVVLTQKRARKLSLKVWRYLRNHPEIRAKWELPTDLYHLVEGMKYECPLCDLFHKSALTLKEACPECPLSQAGHLCNAEDFNQTKKSAYSRWFNGGEEDRFKGARKIVKIIKAWKPKGRP